MNNQNLKEYFLNLSLEDIYADDTYISDGKILGVKERLKNPYIINFKNMEDIISSIPSDKGEEWELPDTVKLFPRGRFYFIYDDIYCYNYEYVRMLEKWFPYLRYYVVRADVKSYKDIPLLKLFDIDDAFVGLIMPVKI